jgi:hypothetical protein
MRRVVEITSIFKTNSTKMEIMMSKALKKARPIVEATLVSVALVAAALAVPAAIVYAAI